ncbi:MAG: hypothetical protein LBD67_08475 [Candidatus Accumulibacter sp.]|nr:hypothetical protein [Accumulibacter sp.]
MSKYERMLRAFPVLILSSNRFSILTLRQAQGERIEKHASDKLDGRTDWKVSSEDV